jgi:four helix bundle protein
MERPGRATWTVTPLGSGERLGRRANQFIAKCGESLRELEETAFWLELLAEGKIIPAETVAGIRQECDELIAIFVTILKRSKEPFETS